MDELEWEKEVPSTGQGTKKLEPVSNNLSQMSISTFFSSLFCLTLINGFPFLFLKLNLFILFFNLTFKDVISGRNLIRRLDRQLATLFLK